MTGFVVGFALLNPAVLNPAPFCLSLDLAYISLQLPLLLLFLRLPPDPLASLLIRSFSTSILDISI